jgi:hypothetical protein
MTAENETLRMCFVDKKDWRLCKSEVCAPTISSIPGHSLFRRQP